MADALRLGQKRKSQFCPKSCNGQGCFDRVEQIRNAQGQLCLAWMVHCKELHRRMKQSLGEITDLMSD